MANLTPPNAALAASAPPGAKPRITPSNLAPIWVRKNQEKKK